MALLALGLTASACSTGDTVVAVNVSSGRDVGDVSKVKITITQEGQDPLTESFKPQTERVDGERSIVSHFYRRMMVPDGWKEAPAVVEVEALNQSELVEDDKITVNIEHERTVPAFLELGQVRAVGGAGGAAAGAAGQAGAAGALAGAGGAAAGAGGEAGAAGEPTAGAGGAAAGAAGQAGAAGGQAGGAGGAAAGAGGTAAGAGGQAGAPA